MDNAKKMQIGARLKEIRKSLGITQSTMAEKLNTSASYISDIEKGKTLISINVVLSLYANYSVDPLWLLTGERRKEGGGADIESEKLKEAYKRIKKLELKIEILKELLAEEREKCDERKDKERGLKRSNINTTKISERK